MTSRRAFVAGAVTVLAAPLAVRAQPVTKIARIGILGVAPTPTPHRPYPTWLNSFFEGLRERGWVDGQNIAFEFREGPDLQANATELVRLKVDVIVTLSGPPTVAAKAATQTIPIVFAANDTVEQGLVASLARPGGNLTGFDWDEMALYSKRVQLLKEVMPRIRRVAFLVDPDLPAARRAVAQAQAAGRALSLEIQPMEPPLDQLNDAFATMTASRVEGVVIAAGPLHWHERKRIVELAARHRLPNIADDRYFVVDGALMTYESATISEAYRLITKHVDRILRGANPADLPVELTTTHHLRINLKTAKALGLTIPPSVLARADEVIQ
jgi:putative ABC transport system substrate-binding protein